MGDYTAALRQLMNRLQPHFHLNYCIIPEILGLSVVPSSDSRLSSNHILLWLFGQYFYELNPLVFLDKLHTQT